MNREIIQALIDAGVLSRDAERAILKDLDTKYKGGLESALVDAGVSVETILQTKSTMYGIPYKLNIPVPTDEVLKYIPTDAVAHYQFIPLTFNKEIEELEVGVTHPENTQAVDALQFIAAKNGISFKTYIISDSDFKRVLGGYEGLETEVGTALTEFEKDTESVDIDKPVSFAKKQLIPTTEQTSIQADSDESLVEDAPIIKIVAVIFRHAIEGDASDIHIENTGEKVRVRFRVDGILHTTLVLPENVSSGVVARIKILSHMQLDEKRKPQDGGFSARIEGRKIDFRVSSFPSHTGEKIVIRILDTERGVKNINEIGLSKENQEMIKRALARPYGLILITGPTGSGKSTTLYSMLKEVDREGKNVVSLEDPVEYNIPNVTQSQVMPEIGYTFAEGLRSVLRQDPDVIMVGEIRDQETARLAIQAALTGHLVLSTLHTNNAIGAVPRLVDMGIDPYLIAPTLALSIAQRLVRRTCDGSQKEVVMDTGIKTMIEKTIADLPPQKKQLFNLEKMYETVGTQTCPSGLKGRVAVFEMFEMTHELEQVILSAPTEQNIYQVVRKQGMITMREDALLKASRGEIPFQDVYEV